MIANMDLLRIYDEHAGCLDAWQSQALLAAAMPQVGNVHVAWAAIADDVARYNALDGKTALEELKDRGTWGGGHDPQTAYNAVTAELEQHIAETICRTATVRSAAA